MGSNDGLIGVPSYSGEGHPISISNISQSSNVQEKISPVKSLSPQEDWVIPAYASWFSLDFIHEIEKRAFPELSHIAPQYQEVRNMIVRIWRSSGKPPVHTTVTAIRRHVSMDVAQLLKIHSFLERWGIINWVPSDASIRVSTPDSHTSVHQELMAEKTTNKPITVDTDAPSKATKKAPPVAWEDEIEEFTLSSTYCHTCGLLIPSSEFYHCLKDPAINLCSNCFNDGRFSSQFYSGDFILLYSRKENNCWSNQELLYLLEGIEMFAAASCNPSSEVWSRVASHVQTRTPMECVQKFISLPVCTSDQPFNLSGHALESATGNSVAAIISLLASAVHPEVAGEASKIALNSLNPDLSNQSQVVDKIISAAPELITKTIDETEDKTRNSLSMLCELVAKKVEAKLSILDALENSLATELAHLKSTFTLPEDGGTSRPLNSEPIRSSLNIETLRQ